MIPLIHITDFSNAVSLILESNCEKNYIYLNDDSNNSQNELVKAIGGQFGSNSFENVLLSTFEETLKCLEINISMTRSPLEVFNSLKWVCKDGPVCNIEKIAQEFMKYRGLITTRICLVGAPASGKSITASRLSEIYNLPVISTKEAINEVLALVTN